MRRPFGRNRAGKHRHNLSWTGTPIVRDNTDASPHPVRHQQACRTAQLSSAQPDVPGTAPQLVDGSVWAAECQPGWASWVRHLVAACVRRRGQECRAGRRTGSEGERLYGDGTDRAQLGIVGCESSLSCCT